MLKDNIGLFITGTDTGVGKTVITAGLLGALRSRGIKAMAIKPIQSGGIQRANQLVSEDAYFYGVVTDLPYTFRELNPICLQAPLAPAVAAKAEGVTISLDTMVDHFRKILIEHQSSKPRGILTQAIKDQVDKIAHTTLLGLANVPSITTGKKAS